MLTAVAFTNRCHNTNYVIFVILGFLFNKFITGDFYIFYNVICIACNIVVLSFNKFKPDWKAR